MKNTYELAQYTRLNGKHQTEWWNFEYKHAEKLLNSWIKDYRIWSKKDNELVQDIAAYDLEGRVIVENYMRMLIRCNESYTVDTVTGAIDIILQDMAEALSTHMRNQYPCLRHTHYVVMRANKMGECVMYIGPYGITAPTALSLLDDDGVFMTQGLAAFRLHFNEIKLIG